MRFTREFWEPKKYVKLIEREDLHAKVFYPANHDQTKPKILAMGFSGKRAKPDFHYNFESEEKRAKYVENYFEGLKAQLNRKSQYKDEKKLASKQFVESLKPGSILYDTWGYEQTNVEFYTVLARSGSTVMIQELGHVTVEGSEGRDCCKVMPGEPYGPVLKKIVRGYSVKICESISLRLWDGSPLYKSWYY